jgi:Tfp pilus assembly protein FimT
MVELMIVVSIIGMLAILSLPGYNRFMQNWKLNGETQQFASVLRTARSAAVMKNIDVVFTFDMDSNTYWYYEDRDGNRSRGASEYLSSTYELTPGVIITAHTFPSRTLIFGSKGNTSNSGTITLRNSNHKNRGIRIYGGTGNISVD